MNKVKKDKKTASGTGGFARGVNRLLSGSYLTREFVQANLPFIFFLVFMMLSYIAYGYWAENNVKTLVQAETELRELKAQHMATEAQLEKIKQQSQVAERMLELGLRESTAPPIVIRSSSNTSSAQ